MATVGEELGLPRAADYPYAPPLERFVFSVDGDPPAFAVAGRTPVLALGSNGAPAQLRRKFAGQAGHIPVSRAVLLDHVVVYSAHFSRYGALPATLHRHAGAVAFVSVTWLDPDQLARMHQTEAIGVNYDYVEFTDLQLEHDEDDLAAPALVGAYVSRAGAMLHRGSPIRLAEVATSGCPWPALMQPAVLRFAHRRVAPELALDVFLTRLVQDEPFRRACTERLQLD